MSYSAFLAPGLKKGSLMTFEPRVALLVRIRGRSIRCKAVADGSPSVKVAADPAVNPEVKLSWVLGGDEASRSSVDWRKSQFQIQTSLSRSAVFRTIFLGVRLCSVLYRRTVDWEAAGLRIFDFHLASRKPADYGV
jgi:hypothetical protein